MVTVDAMGRRDLRLWPDWYHGHRHRLRDGDDGTDMSRCQFVCCVFTGHRWTVRGAACALDCPDHALLAGGLLQRKLGLRVPATRAFLCLQPQRRRSCPARGGASARTSAAPGGPHQQQTCRPGSLPLTACRRHQRHSSSRRRSPERRGRRLLRGRHTCLQPLACRAVQPKVLLPAQRPSRSRRGGRSRTEVLRGRRSLACVHSRTAQQRRQFLHQRRRCQRQRQRPLLTVRAGRSSERMALMVPHARSHLLPVTTAAAAAGTATAAAPAAVAGEAAAATAARCRWRSRSHTCAPASTAMSSG